MIIRYKEHIRAKLSVNGALKSIGNGIKKVGAKLKQGARNLVGRATGGRYGTKGLPRLKRMGGGH